MFHVNIAYIKVMGIFEKKAPVLCRRDVCLNRKLSFTFSLIMRVYIYIYIYVSSGGGEGRGGEGGLCYRILIGQLIHHTDSKQCPLITDTTLRVIYF